MRLEDAHKQMITETLLVHLAGMTQEELAKKTRVSTSHISHIKQGKYTIRVGEKDSPIGDDIFWKLADSLHVPLNGKLKIHFNSRHYLRITDALDKAAITPANILIDSFTADATGKMLSLLSGAGKTYSLKKWAEQRGNAIYIKVESLMKGKDLLEKLLESAGITIEGRMSNTHKLKLIADKFIRPGGVIIIDECDSASTDILRVLKDLVDACQDRCSIILCGLGITEKLRLAKLRKKDLAPQLWRRFSTINRINLPSFTRMDVTAGCAEYGITDAKVCEFVNSQCEDYYSLSEVVKDIVSNLVEKGKPTTWAEVSEMYNIKKAA